MDFRVALQSPRDSNAYTPLVCYSYILNTILGVGCLGIPYAVYHAGLILGLFMVITGSFLSYLTVLWTCETLERKQTADRQCLIGEAESSVEVVALCRMYLGVWGERLYHFCLYSYGYAILVAYSQVFIQALVAQFPALSTVHSAFLYGVIVVPLSCLDLTEQIGVQLFLTMVRFVAVSIMCGSLLIAAPQKSPMPLVNGNGIGLLTSTVLFAQFCHFCVPGLIAPLASHHKASVPAVFGAAMTTTTFIYICLGVLSAIHFGSNVNSSVNLNWATGFPWMSPVLTTFIVLFPAADTLSTFPLIAINVGNSMMDASGFRKLVCRLAASVPPIFLGYAVPDLSFIVHLTGVFGVYLVFIAPALLQLRSKACDPQPTRFATTLSHDSWAYLVLFVGSLGVVVLVAQLI
ncbi:hypothetical protein LEN26_016408 [Aphanomyces euteiches]|nr:hypothetical protein LEN26_016408 [Aphanomyces euteiches]KAH9115622.1 hypothetical protein AeMF1_010371 [Aphanomyces euteiches]KAH9131440.1 hypothetical protein AeNC1_019631 [Aphanomyces euteiches]